MPKKVLIFSLDYYPGEVGGAEVAIKEITDRIPPVEIAFHLLTLHYDKAMPKEEQIGNVHVHRIGFGWKHPTIADRRKFPLHLNKHLFQVTAAFTALRLHRKYRFDGVWAMMAHSCGIPAGIFKWFHPEISYLLTLQEGDPPEQIERKAQPLWRLFKRGFTSADVVQPISTFLGRWAKRMGFRGEPILVPNGVNIAHFSDPVPEAAIAAMRESLGKQPGDIFLVTTSRMVHKNALDDVIRALPHLPTHVHFLIYGGGPEKEKLEALAAELKVEERTHFKGLIGHAEMPTMLRACDIFIRPSRSEGMGNSFVEAMAAKLPVIATQEGGIADFLFDAVRNPEVAATGFAVDKDAPEQIALAVKRVLSDPVTTAHTVETAYAMVVEKYDWEQIARQMREQVFARLFVPTQN
jgi:glycosyltransferase involved in cell wall biosynthesis